MPMPAALQCRRNSQVEPCSSTGFRLFFLVAALWAAFNILFWLPQYLGSFTLPTEFSPLDWHIHEMLYGYVAAAIAGFVTAIQTGRAGYRSTACRLPACFTVARRSRCHSAFGDYRRIDYGAVDASFLIALAIIAAREIIAGKKWRNLRVMIVLVVLIFGNIVFFTCGSISQRFSQLRYPHRHFLVIR